MLIQRLKVSGLLSFGPQGIDLPLGNLNVLIGPNGSGKSNLLEVLALAESCAYEPIHASEGDGRDTRVAVEGRTEGDGGDP